MLNVGWWWDLIHLMYFDDYFTLFYDISACSIWTGDKHKTGSVNYFAIIATAASLLWLHVFGSSTHFSLQCPTARQMTFRSLLFWDVTQHRLVLSYRHFGRMWSIPSYSLTSPRKQQKFHLCQGGSLKSRVIYPHIFLKLFIFSQSLP
jgi:hypothetical protein